jgi:hypothetical protein
MTNNEFNKINREKFVNNIKLKLEINNYGFQIKHNQSINNTEKIYDIDDVKKLKGIQELLIRMNVWIETGKKDKGEILFTEAKRKIIYNLDDININNCKIILKVI